MKIYPVLEAIQWKHGSDVTASIDITTPEVFSWSFKKKVPSKTALKKLCKEYEDATSYLKARQAEYPSIEEQLDMIYHGDLKEWKKSIKAIKDKYPKPEDK